MANYMKCTKCGGVAVMNMPQHRLKLCAEHYGPWVVSMVERAIKRYGMFSTDDRILVAVSGGKDSLTLWDILDKLGYRTSGLYIHLGIGHDAYSDVSQHHIEAFCAERPHLDFQVVDVAKAYGTPIPDLRATRRGRPVCAVCGIVKRHIMNKVAAEGDYAAIATGHNMSDEAAVLFGNTLRWQQNFLRRQAPVLPDSELGLAKKVKPLCLLYEREVAAYALTQDIDYVHQECPYSTHAKTLYYKELLNQLEHRSAGTQMHFYLTYLKAKAEGLFSPESQDTRNAAHLCPECGMPTHADSLCSFCRLWDMQKHD